MLVLARKLGERIWIGDNICITVVDIDRGKIRLGIDAPKDVPVNREELLRRQLAQLDAAQPPGPQPQANDGQQATAMVAEPAGG